jgi:apolipoprotein N-acyltransferase
VIRSANTGVSCIIDPAGNVIDSRPWYREAAIRQVIPAKSNQTFYARFGDCISWVMLGLTALFLSWLIVTFIKTRSGRG